MTYPNLELVETAPDAPEALALIQELSLCLVAITGDDGRKNFSAGSVQSPRARFVVARLGGEPVGCGALRPLELAAYPHVCEIKRMYARTAGGGAGLHTGLAGDAPRQHRRGGFLHAPRLRGAR